MDFSPPRGTADWLPPESERLRAVYELAHRTAGLFGYRYVETPTFEDTELFARSSGGTSDVVSKEMYTFTDRGDRSITLRPEGTAPVVRAYLQHEHELPSPFKGYYVETLFRYGRPQKGRLREYRSFGIEAVAAEQPEADVEVILVGVEFLRQAQVGRFELQLNSIGDETCRPKYREALLAYLEENVERLRDEHRERFRDNPLRVLDCKDDACQAVAAGAPKMSDDDWAWLCADCRPHFEAVRQGLKREGVGFVIVPTLVRGLDYYTRTVFEFVSAELSRSQGSVIAGGRYDGLAEVLGSRTRVPAVGFGMGVERILLALEEEGVDLPPAGGLDAYVVFMGEPVRDYARQVASALRARGRSVDMAFATRPLRAQLHTADRSGARFAVILGEKEAAAGTVTWKRLADGVQSEGSVEQAAESLE